MLCFLQTMVGGLHGHCARAVALRLDDVYVRDDAGICASASSVVCKSHVGLIAALYFLALVTSCISQLNWAWISKKQSERRQIPRDPADLGKEGGHLTVRRMTMLSYYYILFC